MSLKREDPKVFAAIEREAKRQREGLELIASENYSSSAVREATGSVMSDKYAEGYPGKRYYGGCEQYDVVEDLARDRVKRLFNAKFANVQPHSGAQANLAVYLALLKPGDTLLGQSLAHGGHLTHGSPVNASGQLYDFHFYGVDAKTERLDYDEIRKIARRVRPKLVTSGYSAYSRDIDWARLRAIADEVGALLMVDMAHFAGLVAGGVFRSPVPHAHVVTTTTHKTLRGPRGGMIITNDEELAGKFDKAVFPGTQGGPLMHVVAAKAVALGEALRPAFKTYAKQVIKNAAMLAKQLETEGLRIVSGGTDNHSMLMDLRPVGLTGKVAQELLDEALITTNKNMIPGDPESPFVTSGVRIGTPAVTTRGMKEPEMREIGKLITTVLKSPEDEKVRREVGKSVKALTGKFPLPS